MGWKLFLFNKMKSKLLNIFEKHNRQMELSMGFISNLILFEVPNERKKSVIILQMLRQDRKDLLEAIEKRNKQKHIWTKIRTSTFWERELLENDDDYFKQHFRMTRATFLVLCNELKSLDLSDSNCRKCIPLQKRVAIALYALGSSAEYRTIAVIFGVGVSTVCNILLTFCKEVWRVLQPKYLCTYPPSERKIRENVNGFERLGFPQCFGAIDGCHIEIQPPAVDAVDYYNYKGWYSTVLLAVVDYRFRFLYISVGTPGRCNDSLIFENSFAKEQHQQPIFMEMSRNLCGVDVPVVLIGDSAFRFSKTLMKPFPFNTTASLEEKMFNYALSKCRRVVENSFGHLKARFRRVGKGLDNRIDNSVSIIKACCVIHNFLNDNNDEINNQWLQQMNNNPQRVQPERITQIDDFRSIPATIRNAISMHLSLAADLDVEGAMDSAIIGSSSNSEYEAVEYLDSPAPSIDEMEFDSIDSVII